MQFSKTLSFFTWLILLLLAIPTFLILSSWNALPGDSLYGVKRGLEDVLLTLVSPSQNLSSNLSIKYSERRFIEATSLISEKHSIVGLAYFEQQMQETQQQVAKATDPQTKTQLQTQLVNNLTNYQQQLETTKTQIVSSVVISNNLVPTTTSVNLPPTQTVTAGQKEITLVTKTVPSEVTSAPTVAQQNTVTPAPLATAETVKPVSNAQIVAAIDQTQSQISQTIKELEKDKGSKGQDNKSNTEEQKNQNSDNGPKNEHQKDK